MCYLDAKSFFIHAPLLLIPCQVDVQFVRMTKRFIPLSEIKTHHLAHKADGGPLKNMMLFSRQRLSIQPLTQGKSLLFLWSQCHSFWEAASNPDNLEVPLTTLSSLPSQYRGIWFCLEPGRGKATLRNWQQHSLYPAHRCLLLNQHNSQVYSATARRTSLQMIWSFMFLTPTLFVVVVFCLFLNKAF